MLIDDSNFCTTIKEGKNPKTVLLGEEEDKIINTFINKTVENDLSVLVIYEKVSTKNYSLSAGHYFDIKIENTEITIEEYISKMKTFESNLDAFFVESKSLEKEIKNNLKGLKYG